MYMYIYIHCTHIHIHMHIHVHTHTHTGVYGRTMYHFGCDLQIPRPVISSTSFHVGVGQTNYPWDMASVAIKVRHCFLGSLQSNSHRIGLWENLQESPIFNGKIYGFL